MVRMVIQLTEEQRQGLKELSAQRGVSMAEVVRQAVERILDEDERKEKWRRASALVGKFPSGLTDIAEEHDKYLGEEGRW